MKLLNCKLTQFSILWLWSRAWCHWTMAFTCQHNIFHHNCFWNDKCWSDKVEFANFAVIMPRRLDWGCSQNNFGILKLGKHGFSAYCITCIRHFFVTSSIIWNVAREFAVGEVVARYYRQLKQEGRVYYFGWDADEKKN